MRILIADDEALIRMGVKDMLEGLGHEVVGAAADGAEAIRLAELLRPDVVILDIRMPGRDGLSAAEAIAAESPLPILILTAYSDRDLVARAASLAVQTYLVKPIRPEDLSSALQIAVDRFEQWQALSREAADLREALEARQVIEEAKRFLMERDGLKETAAFRYLQSQARRQRRRVRDVAEEVLQFDR